MDRVSMALRICRQHGVEPVKWHPGRTVLFVTGLGAGLVMATVDHLHRCYPTLGIWACGLPGGLGFEARIVCLDWLGSVFPCLFLMASSITDGAAYPNALLDRGFEPFQLWVYGTHLDCSKESITAWRKVGAVLVQSLWRDAPLENLTPSHSLQSGVSGGEETRLGAGG